MLTKYFNDIGKLPLLPAKEIPSLLKKAQEGDQEAEHRIILANLRLVLKAIQGYKGRGVAYDDLVQEGSISLQDAIHKFDFNKGAQFPTYAYRKIQDDIRILFKTNSLIRLSGYRQKQIQAYKKAVRNLEEELECMPSLEQITHKMQTSEKRIILLHEYDTCIEMFETLDQLEDRIDEYSKKNNDNDNQLADPDKKDFVDQIISGKLSQLTDFERKLLITRYQLGEGILTAGPLSFRQAAQILGVSHVYLHKIETILKRKLRRLFTHTENDD